MTADIPLHPLAQDYLRRLRQAGGQLPPERLRELLAEIREHLTEAIPIGTSEDDALGVLERLGPPGEIIEAERPTGAGPTDRRSWREWAAVALLPLGGFAFGVGWLVGLVLLWSSRLWTTREKLIGTLILPGGIATAPVIALLIGTKRRCTGFVTANPSGALIGRRSLQCTPSGGTSAVVSALQITLLVLLVFAPILSAVYLARRARLRSVFMGPALGS